MKRLKIYTVSNAPIDDLVNELKKATDYINAMAKYSNQGGIISLEHLIESIENLQPYEKKLKWHIDNDYHLRYNNFGLKQLTK